MNEDKHDFDHLREKMIRIEFCWNRIEIYMEYIIYFDYNMHIVQHQRLLNMYPILHDWHDSIKARKLFTNIREKFTSKLE